jgi:putative ATP-dependent endonuclease of OLD family
MSVSERTRAFQDILARLSLVLDELKPRQGLGYNNILFMATELILLEQEAGQFPLLLIEEPEAHLHPQLQMKFLKFIRDEFSAGGDPRLQTILTTHSPNLASKAPLGNLIIIKDGSAFPLRQGMTGLDPDDYTFHEKFLDVTKSNLFFAKAVLIVEGDAENILIPTIARLLGRPLENYGVSVVNVGNTAYARYAKIFLRAGADRRPQDWIPIKVACLRDLDLWPAKADELKFPAIGFKTFTERNARFWERHAREGRGLAGTDPAVKKAALETFASGSEEQVPAGRPEAEQAEAVPFVPQNVKVWVSEKWTFEYCLVLSGLASLVYEALKGTTEGFDELPQDPEERAIRLYGMIESTSGAKTGVAYRLALLLDRAYAGRGRREALKARLPQYILDALDHVTGPWPEDLDADPEEDAAPPEAAAPEEGAVRAQAVARDPDGSERS